MMRRVAMLIALLVAVAISIPFCKYNSMIRESKDRLVFVECMGSIIELYMFSVAQESNKIYQVKSYPTKLDSQYQALPIVTFEDLDIKYGDYNYTLAVPIALKDSKLFRAALHELSHPRTFIDTFDKATIPSSSRFTIAYALLRRDYFSRVAKGQHVLTVDYIDFDPSDYRSFVEMPVLMSEQLIVTVE